MMDTISGINVKNGNIPNKGTNDNVTVLLPQLEILLDAVPVVDNTPNRGAGALTRAEWLNNVGRSLPDTALDNSAELAQRLEWIREFTNPDKNDSLYAAGTTNLPAPGAEIDQPYDQPAPNPSGASAGASSVSGDAFGASTATSATTATFNNNIDGLLIGTQWASTSVTFSFTDTFDFRWVFWPFTWDYTDYEAGYPNAATHDPSFQIYTAMMQTAARDFIKSGGQYYNVSGLSPTELTGASDRDATIRMAMSSDPGTAYGYYPANTVEAGDIWVSTNGNYNSPVIGTYAYHTMGHELGHALGLKHGHETGGVNNVSMNADRDSMEFSIMTYRSYVGDPLIGGYSNGFGSYAQTLMMYDIAAVQHMYGAYFGYSSGDTTYTFSTTTGEMFVNGVGQGTPFSNIIFRTIWDGNGTDTYDFSNYTTNLAIDLRPGNWVDLDVGGNFQRAYLGDGNYARAQVFNALQYNGDARSLIENAKGGSGADSIIGNDANNTIWAGSGNDTVDGGLGNDNIFLDDGDDVISSSGGNDTFHGGAGNDVIWGGNDAESYYGDDGADNLKGGGGNDYLDGGFGNDTITAGDGDDSATGGEGDDTLYLGTGNDYVNTTAGGNDIYFGEDGDDYIYGGPGNESYNGGNGSDHLLGWSGNDTLTGDAGIDTLEGGSGDDTYNVDTTTDTLTEYLDSGTDTVRSTVTFSLGANVENLVLLDAAAINGYGNALNNVITGNSNVNTIDADSGADTVYGGDGDDTIWGAGSWVVGDGGDVLYGENGNDVIGGSYGNDVLEGGIGNDLLYGDENNDTLRGGDGNDYLNGAWGWGADAFGNDLLEGGSGDDTLEGGSGIDILVGGSGNDIYYVDNTSDVITENLNAGIDQVYSSATYTLSANVENLTLTGIAAINGTGNTLANVITGNDAANQLSGSNGNDTLTGAGGNDNINGGVGADAMYGGLGDDIYSVNIAGDTVIEFLGEGVDKINSSVSYTLPVNVENLTLTGASAINGIGNSLNNVLIGNSANNQLSSGDGNDTLDGKGGVDTLIGGLGNDGYVVDNAGDVITENLGEGTDRVSSSITYTLPVNVENMTLTGIASIDGTGNGLANVITGNSGNNIIAGGGGNDTLDGKGGVDTLTGGAGQDKFKFTTTGGIDTITDFVVVDDTVQLENAVYTALTVTGTLAAGQFIIGAAAADANDYVIYNNATGALLYDADGNGVGGTTQIATLSAGLAMTNADIVVI